MHELSIAQAVVTLAERHAGGRRVERVTLRVGALRQVVPRSLEFAFELVARDTPVEGAELVLELSPARISCRGCGGEQDLIAFPMTCGACGSHDIEVAGGEELEVVSLDVLDHVPAAERG